MLGAMPHHVPQPTVGLPPDAIRSLVEAGNSLLLEHDVERLLVRVVELATELVGATYGALGVLDESGTKLARFLTVGIDDELRAKIGPLPTGKGILGVLIREPQPLRLDDLSSDPRSAGFPPHHPPMGSFLGVPIPGRGRVAGRLYLTDKVGGGSFTDADQELATLLASQAGIAIANAELWGELERTNRELETASRHKNDFLASMSHELRSPLNTIIGYTQLLLDDPENLNEEQREDLGIIRSSGKQLLGLIGDLLDLERIERGAIVLQLGRVDVADLVTDVVASMRTLVAAGVELRCRVDDGLVVVGDRNRLRQLLLNLVGNAAKFTESGSITIEAERDDTVMTVRVIDTGPGIPADDVQRIFDSFFQSQAALARTPRANEGAGLGLAIARDLARLHDGDIELSSVEGEGTTLTVTLPLAGPVARDHEHEDDHGDGAAQ
jgi:signal transduction histidine kinase